MPFAFNAGGVAVVLRTTRYPPPSTPDAGAGDRKQAQQLLEPMLDGKHDSGLKALAALLNAHLTALNLAQQQGIQQGQKRIDELEKKLDAVKDIERSLLRREKGKL